ncbi:MAG: SigE family RNA polymerase sigma factor [Propionibacteriaceae bacterium]|nr:SigE family RNA polymerase sigma factor [Propionibacteriaceae bacterium]
MKDATRDAEFTDFMRSASASLGRTAWLLCGDAHAAADLVQAALVKTYVAWPRVRPAEALAYARRALVNESIDRWRRRRPEVPVGADFDRPLPDEPTSRIDDRDRIARLLATLPSRQRTVVVLRYYDDLSERAVAEHLGISVGAVKSAASRALASLRGRSEPLAPDDEPLAREGGFR